MLEEPTCECHGARSIEQFIYAEARLLDDGRLDEWMSLWTPEVEYWIPSGHTQSDPTQRVSIVYDDATRLRERVTRLTNADAHSQEPASRLTHYMTAIQRGAPVEGAILVHAAMLIVEVRKGLQEIYGGRVDYELIDVDDGLRMRSKRIHLTRNDSPIGNLTFLL